MGQWLRINSNRPNMSIALDLSDLNRSVTWTVLQTFAESLMLINPLDPEANKDVCDYQMMAETFADFDANHPHSLVACIFVQDGIIKGTRKLNAKWSYKQSRSQNTQQCHG